MLEPTIAATSIPSVALTAAAAAKLGEFAAGEDLALRVYIVQGGCSGFRYGMMLEDDIRTDDTIIESEGRRLVVDAASLPLLAGASIDYLDTLMGAGFTVNNPNAVAACGCGSSFRTADSEGKASGCAH